MFLKAWETVSGELFLFVITSKIYNLQKGIYLIDVRRPLKFLEIYFPDLVTFFSTSCLILLAAFAKIHFPFHEVTSFHLGSMFSCVFVSLATAFFLLSSILY